MNLKQLSEKLGLSQTTISRALNGYPEVNEATRQRVVDAAERFNYRPNSRAKGLATGRALAIGHVIPIKTRHEMVNPIFGDFIAGAGETYAANGYEMVITMTEDSKEAEVYRSLKSRGAVDGVVVHGPTLNDPRIALLHRVGLPFVVHGRSSQVTQDYDWLDVNNRRAFERATRFLLDLGHRRIGLINGLETQEFAARRRAGYEAMLTQAGIAIDPALMRSDEMTEANGHRGAAEMLDGPDPPTAIVASSLISAIGVRRALEERQLKMGRDVSVLTYDDMLSYLRNGTDVPIFTAVRSSVREAGRRLAEILIRRIADPHGPPEHVMLEAELVVGQSTGPAPRWPAGQA